MNKKSRFETKLEKLIAQARDQTGIDTPVEIVKPYRKNGDPSVAYAICFRNRNAIGVYNLVTERVYLNYESIKRITKETRSWSTAWLVVVHELAHSMGLGHIDGHILMQKKITPLVDFDLTDDQKEVIVVSMWDKIAKLKEAA